jgi:hypothetical protein
MARKMATYTLQHLVPPPEIVNNSINNINLKIKKQHSPGTNGQ